MLKRLGQHARAVVFITLGLCAIGLVSVITMPVAIFPRLTIPRVMIDASGGDAPAQTVLVAVTRPLEQAFSTLPNLELMQSTTTRGSTGFTLTFTWGTDVDQSLQLVNARIAQVRSTLPAGLDIQSDRLNPTIFPILDYSLTSKTRSLSDLRNLALYTIRPRLARLPGVRRVMVDGGQIKEYQVQVSPTRLASYSLSVSQVDDALSKANTITAVGNYDNHYLRHLVMVNGLLAGPDTIRRVVVAVKNGTPITIGDVADVQEAVQRQTVLATGNGEPAVLFNIVRQPDGNTIDVAREVKAALVEARAALPHDITIRSFYDQSQIVQESENSVVEAILVGGALALVVLILFLKNGRAAFTALSLLPLTIIITFGVMRFLGLDLNIMTLGALAVALGLVIDDGIVVVEHIYHHLERGIPRSVAVPRAMQEIAPAMVASSAASVVTFLPLVFLPGVTGNFFSALAVTMIATLVVSLLLALVVCPTVALRMLPRRLGRHGSPTSGNISREAPFADGASPMNGHQAKHKAVPHQRGAFERLSRWSLRHRPIVLLSLVPLAAVLIWLSGHLESGFMPEFDEGAFVMDYRMPAGTSITETDRVMRTVEEIIGREDGVKNWSRLTGALSGSGLELTPQNQGDLLVQLKSGRRPGSDDIQASLRTKILTAEPELQVDFAQILGDLIGDLSGNPSPIEVKIFGPDMEGLRSLAHVVGHRIARIKGVVDESDGIVDSGPETEVKIDPVRAAQAGISNDVLTAATQAILDGQEVGSVLKGEILEPIRVKYPGSSEPEMDNTMLAAMPILSPSGQAVPLSSVADVVVQPGTPDLNRENQRLMASVTARLDKLDLGTAIREVKKSLRDVTLPPGYSIEYGGLYKSQQESFRSLTITLLLAILFVVSVLIVTFRSFRVVASLLAAAVLSLSGVLVALYVTGTPLNISSFTGAIMIVGIVTENGVLLFDELQRLQRVGSAFTIEELLSLAVKARLRPILMTTFAAILTLLPLSFGIGAGAAMQKPLAVAVIGGLTLSVFFTLVLAPVIYAGLSSLRRAVRARKYGTMRLRHPRHRSHIKGPESKSNANGQP